MAIIGYARTSTREQEAGFCQGSRHCPLAEEGLGGL
jgi:hypothetical protein